MAVTEGMTCWEDSETGCVCGNDCAPPSWMFAEVKKPQCDRCKEPTEATRIVVDYYGIRHQQCEECAKHTVLETLEEIRYDTEHFG